jgi:hypothetical protein
VGRARTPRPAAVVTVVVTFVVMPDRHRAGMHSRWIGTRRPPREHAGVITRPRQRPRQDLLAVGTFVGTFVGTRPSCTTAMCDVEDNREPVRGSRRRARGNRATREISSGATLRATLGAIATTTPARVEVAR